MIENDSLKLRLKQYLFLFKLNKVQNDSKPPLNLFSKRQDSNLKDPLDFLVEGYYHFYFENDRVVAYENFINGINTGLELSLELKKALLLGLFKVVNSGFTVAENDFEDYLKMFNNISSDDFDKFWYHYYRIELNDLTNDYLEGDHQNFEFYKSQVDSLNLLRKRLNSSNIISLISLINGNFNVKYDGQIAYDYYDDAETRLENNVFFERYIYRLKVDKARSLNAMGQPRLAINYLESQERFIYTGDTLVNLLNKNFFLSEFYKKIAIWDSAYFHLKRMVDLEKERNFVEENIEISRRKIELKTDRKEKQILKEQEKARTNRNWLIVASLALIFGAGIAILIQKNTTKKRQLAEQEAILKQQRVENLLKEQELVSIDAMIAGQEKERQKVAGELHDDLGSSMATIKLHFDNAEVDKKDPALQNAQKLLEEAYQKIRGMAHSKNSGVMSDQGLLPAIKKMAKTITDTDALEVTVEDFGLGERLENSLELSVFRMIQELVANAIKHAEASHVNVQLTQYEDNLNIIVEDNGKGFDHSQLDQNQSGMGLTTIEKRVEHLEGTFTVDSIVGKGTSILIDIPV